MLNVMRKLIVSTIMGAILLISCEQGEHGLMYNAEALILERPEESFELLQSVSLSNLKSPGLRAKYALLMTQALDKNYIDVSSDSLIRFAVDYYDGTNNHYYKMLAFYYEGIVLLNAHYHAESAIYFEKAINEASIIDDYFYMGLSNRALSQIMNETNNYTQAIFYDELAIKCFKKCQKNNYEQYQWLALSINCSNDKQYSKAISISDSLISTVDSETLRGRFKLVKAEALIESGLGDYETPINIYRNINRNLFELSDYCFYAFALDKMNLRDSSDAYLHNAYLFSRDHIDFAVVQVFNARIEHNRAHYKNAYRLLSDAVDVQDSLTRELLRQSVSVAQKDYFNKEAQYLALRAKTARLYVFIVSLASIFAFAIILFWIILRQRKKDSIIKDQITQLALEKETTKKLYAEKAHILGSLFSERIGHLDHLAIEYVSAETPEEKETIFREYKHRCSSIFKDKLIFKSLENDLNNHCDAIIKKLRTEIPTIKERHLNIIILFFSGIPNIVVQAITGKPSLKAVEVERSRFRKAIRESGAEHTQVFLQMLDTKTRQHGE